MFAALGFRPFPIITWPAICGQHNVPISENFTDQMSLPTKWRASWVLSCKMQSIPMHQNRPFNNIKMSILSVEVDLRWNIGSVRIHRFVHVMSIPESIFVVTLMFPNRPMIGFQTYSQRLDSRYLFLRSDHPETGLGFVGKLVFSSFNICMANDHLKIVSSGRSTRNPSGPARNHWSSENMNHYTLTFRQ